MLVIIFKHTIDILEPVILQVSRLNELDLHPYPTSPKTLLQLLTQPFKTFKPFLGESGCSKTNPNQRTCALVTWQFNRVDLIFLWDDWFLIEVSPLVPENLNAVLFRNVFR